MNFITLFQLNSLIRQTLDLNLEPSYWVVAEIGEVRINQKGHCYLELIEKEEDNLCAKIKANIWAYTYRNICGWFESITGKSLQPGMKILTQVTVTFHEIYGISLNIKDIDPNFTLGERARKRQEVIEQLKKDGVFEMNKDLTLPLAPQRIAVISSPSAAGYEDFCMQINKNSFHYKFELTLFKAMMQGGEAKNSIISSLHKVFLQIDDFDLLVIIRGGGAQVDLDCFDTYELASHIAQFPLPVITGIGHERDETIVDLVAHTKIKTPTAVAEFLISGLRTLEDKLKEAEKKICKYFENFLVGQKHKISACAQKLQYHSQSHLANSKIHLDRLQSGIVYNLSAQLNEKKYKVENLQDKILNLSKNQLFQQNLMLKNLEKNISCLHPDHVLKRGYTITRINNKPIKDTNFNSGDIISTESYHSLITSRIDAFKKKNGK
ncbi:exodeoxyribonuclease VII large subunit [soil metagenome]